MRRALLGTVTYLEMGATLLAWLPVMSVARLTRDDTVHRVPGRWLRRYARVVSRLSPLWDFSVEGTPPADIHSRAYVVVSNHESNADPFLLSSLPWDMRWLGKSELLKVPFTGWMMKLSGDIFFKRGDGDSVRAMLEECARTLRHGLSVMVFPEGTRSTDGTLGKFKDGAFELAIAAQVPILPVALAGTRNCMPKGSAFLGEAKAVARVLTPIPTEGMTKDDLPRLREAARDLIAKAAAELRERLAVK